MIYNILRDPFYPMIDSQGAVVQVPLGKILTGEVVGDPHHPDPVMEAFFRYIPSLVLQVLAPTIEDDQWRDLVINGTETQFFPTYQSMIQGCIEEQSPLFDLHPDRNGFYQHHEVKRAVLKGEKGVKLVEGMDGIVMHQVDGNNHCHHKQPKALDKMCPSCALISLIHHNNFCVAGLAGPANIRGNQAYLCMVHKSDSFRRQIANYYLCHEETEEVTDTQNWITDSKLDQPSWKRPGTPKGKTFIVKAGRDVGLRRVMLHTPRHAFFDFEQATDALLCDYCHQPSDTVVRKYYWRIGDEVQGTVGHPALAVYFDTKKPDLILPQNYNPSLWRNLGGVAMSQFEDKKNLYRAAPIVQQYALLFDEELGVDAEPDEIRLTLELQAYQTDKAKLLGFHHQLIHLPKSLSGPGLAGRDQGKAERFFKELTRFSDVIAELLSAFRYFGSADKKRTRVDLPHIQDQHDRLKEAWGEAVLANLDHYFELLLESPQALLLAMAKTLEEYKADLNRRFGKLAESYPLEDWSAQKRLQVQARSLAARLKKLVAEFNPTTP